MSAYGSRQPEILFNNYNFLGQITGYTWECGIEVRNQRVIAWSFNDLSSILVYYTMSCILHLFCVCRISRNDVMFFEDDITDDIKVQKGGKPWNPLSSASFYPVSYI